MSLNVIYWIICIVSLLMIHLNQVTCQSYPNDPTNTDDFKDIKQHIKRYSREANTPIENIKQKRFKRMELYIELASVVQIADKPK